MAKAEINDLPWPVARAVYEYQVTPNSEPISLEGDVAGKISKIRAERETTVFNDAAPQPGSKLLRRNKVGPISPQPRSVKRD
jgi:hypothetical protein